MTPVTISGNTFTNATSVTITEDGAGSVSPATSGTSPFDFTYTPAAGDAGNTVTITVTTDNPSGAPCAAAVSTYTLTVNALPAEPVQTTDCSLGSGNASVTVTSPTGAGLEYSLDGGTFQSGVTFTAVAEGSHAITVRNAAGCSTTGTSFTVSCGCANAPALSLSASSGSTCGLTPVTISGNTFTNATSVTITEDGAGSVSPATSGTSPFAFTYTPAAGDAGNIVTITVTTDNPSGSPCAAAVATYTLTVNALPAVPAAASPTQPTCTVPTGSVVLSNLPAGNWTINPGAITGSGASTAISSLTPGTYNFTVTDATGCTSAPSADVIITSQPATPSAPVVTLTQPTCAVATGTIAVTVQNAGDTYSFDNGVTFQAGNVSSPLTPANYNVVIRSSGGCNSIATPATINAQPLSPAVPVETTDCSAGPGNASVTVSSPTGAGLEYSLDGGAFQAAVTFTGVANGNHTITVRNAAGCTTTGASFSVSCGCVNGPELLLSSTTGNTCGLTPVTISGNTFTNATSVTITEDGAGSVSPASSGTSPFDFTYTPAAGDAGNTVTITVTTDNPSGAPCAAAVATYTLTVNALPAAPTAAVPIQPTCTVPTGSVVLNSLPAGNWTINPGAITGSGTSTTISSLIPGTYNFTVTDATGCTSAPSADVVINPAPGAPAEPVQTTDCSLGSGNASVTVTSPTGAGLEYSLDGGTFQSGVTFTAVAEGSHAITVRNAAGCSTTGTSFTVSCGCANAPALSLSASSGSTCGLTPVTISGNTFTNATSVTITEDGAGSVSPATSGTSPFAFTYTPAAGDAGNIVTITFTTDNPSGSPCSAAVSTYTLTVNALPAVPSAASPTQPTCTVPTGSVVLSNLPAGNWTINPGAMTGSGASTAISSLTPGTYNFTVTDATGCTSAPSADVIITSQPATPSAPVVTLTQPTCAVATGTIAVTVQNAGDTYSFDNGVTFQAGNVSSPLTPANYNVVIRSSGGCNSIATPATINAQPLSPAVPVETTDCSAGPGNASVTVSSPTGAGLEYSLDGGTFQAGVTFTGIANGSHTITVRNAAGCTTTGASFSVSCGCVNGPELLLSSTTGNTCGLTPVTISGNTFTNATSVTITEDGAGSVSPASSGTSPFDFTYTPAAGDAGNTVTITVTTDNPSGAPCAAAVATYTLTVNALPAAPTAAVPIQPTCTVPTGSVVLNSLPAGNWTINPGAITGSGTSTTISSLIPGTYNFTVTDATGCTSAPSADVVINPAPGAPAEPVQTTDCSLGSGNASVTVTSPTGAGLEYSLDGGTFQSGITFTAVAEGSHAITVRNAAGCSTTGTSFTVSCGCANAPALSLSASSGSTCGLTPVTISGNTFTNATSVTITEDGAGSVSPATSGTSPFAFTYTPAAGDAGNIVTITFTTDNPSGSPCAAAVSTYTLTVNALPAVPSAASPTQPTCTVPTGSVVLSNLPAGNWTINPGTMTGSGASTAISSLTPGTYNFTVTNDAGCTSALSADVVITSQPVAPSAPVVALTQPTCAVAMGTIAVTVQNAGDTYSFDNGATFQAGNVSSPLTPANYNVVIRSSGGCNSIATPATINAQPLSPAVPVETTDCSAGPGNASVTVSSPTGAGLEYSLDGGTFQAGVTFTGIANGSHTITVRNAAGCTTTGASFSVSCGCVNGPELLLSSTTGNTCGLTPVTISGNTFTNATSVTITEDGAGSVNPASSGTSPFDFTYTPAAGDAGNTVTITVTTDNPSGAPCAAAVATYTLTVNALPAAPTAAVPIQPTCTVPTGSVVLSSLPAGNWTINPGAITGSGTSTTISSLIPGTYNFTVTDATGCTSDPSADVIINPAPGAPAEPVQTTDCSLGSGNASVTVTSPTGAGLEYSLDGGPFQSAVGFTEVTDGSHSITVRNAAGCTTAGPSFSVSCGCANGPDLLLSSTSGSTCGLTPVTISGNTFTNATSVNITEDGAGSVSPPTPGTSPFDFTYTPAAGDAGNTVTITVTTDNPSGSPCAAAVATYTLTVNALPAVPAAAAPTQPTCTVPTGSVVLSNLPAGNWTINPGAITGSSASATISSLTPGTYNFTVTNATGCTSDPSADVIIITAPGSPAAPSAGLITQPSCGETTGSVILNNLPAGNWTINPGAITGTETSTTISALAPGTYSFNVTNDAGCTSAQSANVIINAAPVTPSAPAAGPVTQPTCELATGSIVLNNLPSGNWTINPGAITGTVTSTTISGLTTGTYNFTVTTAAGCTSAPSVNIVINGQPLAPPAPAVSLTQPTCALPTGTITVTIQSAGESYSFDNGVTFEPGNSKPGLAPGTYYVIVRNSEGCNSSATTAVINIAPGAPSVPEQTIDCAPGIGNATITVTSPTGAGLEYSLDGGTYQSGLTFTGIANGSHSLSVRNTTGCSTTGPVFQVSCGCPDAPALVLGSTSGSTCGTAPVTITGNTFTNATNVTITENGAGSVTPVTTSASSFDFTYTPAAADAGNTVTITIITDNPTGAPCAEAAANYTLTVKTTPAAPSIGTINQPASCDAGSGSIVLNGLPATGTWSINAGAITGTGSSTTITGLTGNTYAYTVTNEEGCTSPPSANAVINSVAGSPAMPEFAVTDPSCTSTTGTITVTSATAGLTFSLDGAAFIPYPADGFTSMTSGTHTLTAQNGAGCISPVAYVVVSGQPNIKDEYSTELSDFNGFNVSCMGQSNGYIQINTMGDPAQFKYSWSGPTGFTSSNKDISGLVAGEYTVIISDKNSCTVSETFTLTEPGQLSMTIIPSFSFDGAYNIDCAGSTAASVSVEATNTTGVVSYLWSDGGTGNYRTDLKAGNYGIVLTDANNCQLTSDVTLTEPKPIKLSIEVITQPFCPERPDGSLGLTVSGGIPGGDNSYTYLWSDNSTTQNITNIPAGSYNVTVTDNNSCSVSASVILSAEQETCLIINDAISPNGDLVNDVWNIGNTDLYPDMVVTIYNRWGQLLWRSAPGYPVPWDGKSSGDNLPIDSYHYVIDLHNGMKLLIGNVTIVR